MRVPRLVGDSSSLQQLCRFSCCCWRGRNKKKLQWLQWAEEQSRRWSSLRRERVGERGRAVKSLVFIFRSCQLSPLCMLHLVWPACVCLSQSVSQSVAVAVAVPSASPSPPRWVSFVLRCAIVEPLLNFEIALKLLCSHQSISIAPLFTARLLSCRQHFSADLNFMALGLKRCQLWTWKKRNRRKVKHENETWNGSRAKAKEEGKKENRKLKRRQRE